MPYSEEELTERFEEAVDNAGIRSVSVDGMSVSNDSDAELKAIDRLEQRRAARTRGFLPIGMTKIISRGLQ